jgi:magnesium chelatase family protein
MTIPPAVRLAEGIDTTRIHRVAGLTGGRTAIVTTRPFRAPHQTIAEGGRIGGGQVPLPGEVSRAHDEVLFVDELPALCCHVLEVLRPPLDGAIDTILALA